MRRTARLRELVHDMRRPLAAIDALVGSAETDPDVPPHVSECLDRIREQVRDLNELCVRVVSGASRWHVVDLDALVTAAADDAGLTHRTRVEVEAVPATVVGDGVNLRRAVGNLLENACRASAGGVRAAVRTTTEEVHIEVTDAGPGFGNGPAGTASLGLAIVDAVAREHDGRVETGVSEHGGARVTLVLPREPAPVRRGWATGTTP